MGSLEVLKDGLALLSNVLKTEKNFKFTDELIEAFYFKVQSYSDEEIMKALDRCFNELNFFPSPLELLDRIPQHKLTKNDQHLRDRFTCQQCKQKVSAISDGLCLDCAQINPMLNKPKEKYEATKQNPFLMRGNLMCQHCKKGPRLCIKEPVDSVIWKCQDCYTGLTKEERSGRLGDLAKMAVNKRHKPDWMKDTE